MKKERHTIITGTGHIIPPVVVKNEDFIYGPDSRTEMRKFYRPDGERVQYSDIARKGQIKPTPDIVANLEKITGIRERRWATPEVVVSYLCTEAAARALSSSKTDPSSIDLVIVAHNFGDKLGKGAILDLVPSMASRLKNRLAIKMPELIAFDVILTPEHFSWLESARFGLESEEETLVIGKGLGGRTLHLDSLVEVAEEKINESRINPETVKQIVVPHLDTGAGSIDCVAGAVKNNLGINPAAITYDLVFGCPGWIQALIDADRHLVSGQCKKALVIGGETCSRFAEDTDMDCMIFADGAGAVICEAFKSREPAGILSYTSRSDTDRAHLLTLSPAYCPDYRGKELFIDMKGHDVFKYGVRYVAPAVQKSLKLSGVDQQDVHKFLLHQANEKMDIAIFNRLNGNQRVNMSEKMPMTISWLGNSSVATIPTMLDLILKEDPRMEGHRIGPGDNLVFASVGAGMNINSMVYRMPDL